MADFVSSMPGEVINGTPDGDNLTALHDNVTLNGGAGDDNLYSALGVDGAIMDGGPGLDFLTGQGANDTASYASAPAGVTVDLYVPDFGIGAALEDGFGSLDGLIQIENVTGSAFADSLTGDDFANVLQGGGGDDMLAGEGGGDVFTYSFNLAQSPGGGSSTTYKFTDWLSEKYGKDFGDALPDCDPSERDHHKHEKHSKHDKHDKHDKHEKHSKHEGHDKHDGHHHKHGADSSDDCLTQGFFSKNYTEWLKAVVVTDLVAQGLAEDVNGNGKIDVELNQNDPFGTPFIEGLSAEELAGVFSGRDGVTLEHGKHTHERFYSNEYTSGDGGDPVATVTSDDGFDTIVDFGNGADKLKFNFSADSNWADGQGDPLGYLESFFNVDNADYTGDSAIDTRVSLDMDNDGTVEWSVVLADNELNATQVFDAIDIYVNGALIG